MQSTQTLTERHTEAKTHMQNKQHHYKAILTAGGENSSLGRLSHGETLHRAVRWQ